MKRILWMALCCLPLSPALAAAPVPADDTVVLARGEAVPMPELDTLRGGYAVPGGAVMSFGISQAVYIDGQLASLQSLNIADVGKAVSQAGAVSAGLTSLALSGGSLSTGMTNVVQSMLPTVVTVQNSVDGRLIQTLTTLNLSAPSLSAFNALQLGRSLQQATLGSVLR